MKYSFLLLGLIVLAFLTACDTSEKDWATAVETNTQTAYTEYLVKHPDSPYTGEATKLAQDFIIIANGIPSIDERWTTHNEGVELTIQPQWADRHAQIDTGSVKAISSDGSAASAVLIFFRDFENVEISYGGTRVTQSVTMEGVAYGIDQDTFYAFDFTRDGTATIWLFFDADVHTIHEIEIFGQKFALTP